MIPAIIATLIRTKQTLSDSVYSIWFVLNSPVWDPPTVWDAVWVYIGVHIGVNIVAMIIYLLLYNFEMIYKM